jgi:NDP-sugar pyrophosphorylase family protein
MIGVIYTVREQSSISLFGKDVPLRMLPFFNKALFEIQLEAFARQKFEQIFVFDSTHARKMHEQFGNGEKWGLDIAYFGEAELTDLRNRLFNLDNQVVVALNANVLLNADLGELVHLHATSRRGSQNVHISRMRQLPSYGKNARLDRKLLAMDAVDLGVYLELLIAGIDPVIIGENIINREFLTRNTIRQIDSAKEYWDVQMEALSMEIPEYDYAGWSDDNRIWSGVKSVLAPGQNLGRRLILGSHSRIMKGVSFHGTNIVGDGVMIDKNARIANSIILSNTYVGSDTDISNAIVSGNDVYIVPRDVRLNITDPRILSGTKRTWFASSRETGLFATN